MSFNWEQAQAAIVGWIRTGSGYGSGKILWANQNTDRPAQDFISVKVTALAKIGPTERVKLQDLGRPNGQEIEFRAEDEKDLTVTVEAYCSRVTGSLMAMAVLSKVQTAIELATVRSTFALAGIWCVDPGSVQDLSALLGTEFEGRAVLDVRFRFNDQVSEFVGYIATCEPESFLGPPASGTESDIDI